MSINFFYNLPHLILLCCLMSCSKESKTINDWQRMNLKGKIQQIDELKYATYADLRQKNASKKNLTRFKKNGLISSSGIYRANNNMLWMKYHYSLDLDSIWIREVIEIGGKNEQPQAYWLYLLDEKGAQINITSILIDSSINFHIDLAVNNDGNATEIIYSQQKYPNNIPCRITKIYDEKGRIKEELTYRYDEIRKKCEDHPTTSVFKLNEQGDIIEEVLTTYDGRKRNHSYHYDYDDKGNWIQRVHYTRGAVMDIMVRKFTYYSEPTSN